MKKRISAILVLTMLLALPACAAKSPAQQAPAASEHTQADSAGPAYEEPVSESEPEVPAFDEAPVETPEEASGEEAEHTESKTLIAYFSCTGTTKAAAEQLASLTDAELCEITPEEPYTSDDLDYNSDCRANREQNDPDARPAIAGTLPDLSQYDTVLLGYPIWWGKAPKIIYTFLESYDFSGKTILPFCTSGSSGIGGSLADLQALASDAVWLDGQRFSGSADENDVKAWVDGLGIAK